MRFMEQRREGLQNLLLLLKDMLMRLCFESVGLIGICVPEFCLMLALIIQKGQKTAYINTLPISPGAKSKDLGFLSCPKPHIFLKSIEFFNEMMWFSVL